MRPTGHVDIAAARLNADMMSIDFYLIAGAKRQRSIGCCRVLKS
jgi:hypothetical protein